MQIVTHDNPSLCTCNMSLGNGTCCIRLMLGKYHLPCIWLHSRPCNVQALNNFKEHKYTTLVFISLTLIVGVNIFSFNQNIFCIVIWNEDNNQKEKTTFGWHHHRQGKLIPETREMLEWLMSHAPMIIVLLLLWYWHWLGIPLERVRIHLGRFQYYEGSFCSF